VDDCQWLLTNDRCQLPMRTCSVSRRYSEFVDRSFGVNEHGRSLKLCNSLQNELRNDDISFDCFKRRLKTLLIDSA